jgi:hypothetical protein
MPKAVEMLFDVGIRPITTADFEFIRSLASKFPTFTIPSEFNLWFLSHYHPDYCRVLEQVSEGPKAYLLAMPTSSPTAGIAIWQVAASGLNRPFALEYFAAYLRDLVDRANVTSISFSASQDEATLRLIESLARRFFNSDVTRMHSVPAGQAECEYRFFPTPLKNTSPSEAIKS